MTFLIYFVCFLGASIVQTLLRFMLRSGATPVIPGTVIIYGVAIWAANKWSKAYKEKKEMKQIQNELVAEHKDDHQDDK